MTERILADRIIESGALFQGPWALERVGHEQWVLRGTKENLPKLFELLEGVIFPNGNKIMIELAGDMKLALHRTIEHIQLRIYNKERMESLIGRDERKLVVTPESIEGVKTWLDDALKGGVSQISYLAETLSVFDERESDDEQV